MTNTYADPGNSKKDEVRFLLGDTGPEWFLSDEEINYFLTRYGSQYGDQVEMIASVLADSIAAKYAREASISADGVSVNLGQVAQQFRELAMNLRTQYKNLLVGGFPDVGGVSPDEGLTPGVRQFSFGTGMHDDAEAGPQDYGSRDGAPYYDPYEHPGA